jgi:hypothetical protein
MFVFVAVVTWSSPQLAPQTALKPVAQAPRFEDYPVAKIFRGKPRAPVLSTREARDFRTQLRHQAAKGPNFAGHFTVVQWGCGAGCATVAIIDANTGNVEEFAPLTFEDAWRDGRIICPHGSGFEITSELFILQGDVNGKVGTHYFRWHNRRFSLLHVEPCSI